MAFALIASAAATSDGADYTVTVPFTPIDTTGADFGVLHLGYWDQAVGTPTIVDNQGNTWIPLNEYTRHNPATGQDSRLYYCANPTVGPGHTLYASAVDLYGSLCVSFFSGSVLVSPFDQQNGASDDTNAPTLQPGPVTPSQDGELIFTGLTADGGSPAIGSGFSTPIGVAPAGFSYGSNAAYLIQTAAAVSNPTWSSIFTGGSATSIATFKSAMAAPTVTGVVPNAGTTAGGTSVTITGTGFLPSPDVTFGGDAATSIVRVSSTEITADTPAHAAGPVDVVVTNSDTQSGTLVNGYAYAVAPSGPGSSSGHTIGMKISIGL